MRTFTKCLLTFVCLFGALTAPVFATISNQTYIKTALGDGMTQTFSFPFKIFLASDLVVNLIDTSNVAHLQALTTNYTVTINSVGEGGSITFVTAPTTGWTVNITRVEPFTQSVNISTEGALPAQQINNQLDQLTMLAIQVNGAVGLAVQMTPLYVGSPWVIPLPTANYILQANSTATGFQWAPMPATGPAGPAGPQGPAGPAGSGSGNVIGPGTNTANNIPQWNGANSLVLKDGVGIGTGTNQMLQIAVAGTLPVLDGHNLTNIGIGTANITGTISTLNGGTGSSANANAHSGVVVLDSSGRLPAVDASQLINIPQVSAAFVPNNMQIFTTSGTWTKPAGVSNVYVKVIGGGAAGGAGGTAGGGGGGGGGGYAEGPIAVNTATVTVTIGATNSFAGSTTISATAGTAGGSGATGGAGGGGGGGSNGIINATGATGQNGTVVASTSATGGSGGGTIMGGGGGGGAAGIGTNGGNYGGGGGGGSYKSASTYAGGSGDAGAVIVYY